MAKQYMVWYSQHMREILEADSLTACADLIRATRDEPEFTIVPFERWEDYIRTMHGMDQDLKLNRNYGGARRRYSDQIRKKGGGAETSPSPVIS